MHELGITEEIISIACERAQGEKIKRIVLEIGRLSMVLPSAVQFCFPICSQGTSADGATLEIIEVPGLARCKSCGNQFQLEQAFGRCECQGIDLEWLAGEELKIKEMELF